MQTKPGVFDDLTVAILAFPGAEELDVFGPYEVLWWISTFEGYQPGRPVTQTEFQTTFAAHTGTNPHVFTVGPTTTPYQLSAGSTFTPQYSYANAPHANVVLVPGGHGSWDFDELKANGTFDYVHQIATAPDNQYIMAVCSGSFTLGKLGLLDGHFCSVNHTLYDHFDALFPKAELVRNANLSFVQDGKLLTSNAPASGIAVALQLVQTHCGTGYKDNIKQLLSYAPATEIVGAVSHAGHLMPASV
ncbi:DJ-1/PfpI family protein [Lactiplantibacillus carotarum]|uniref:DJ-1/PfpI family protein n=1 Tax=Lactiplantibacillus carotarum TaxID=2993456 RepID=UPI00298F34CB|nr:DJ-1/PfpI family protein [Lactiplantibacillus carotarum]